MENGAVKAFAEWKKALDVAQAEVGKKGKLPKPKEDLKPALAKCVELAKTLDQQSKQLLTTIKAYQTALTDVEAACDGYKKQVEKDEFGLKKDGDAEERSINAARHGLSKKLDEIGLGSKSPRKQAQKVRDALESADLGSF